MKPTEEQLKEIAEEHEIGMQCYFHFKTGELISIPDMEDFYDGDFEDWEDDIKKVEENEDDYYLFKKKGSRDSYRDMEAFVETVDDAKLQDELVEALNKKGPFRNFKWVIDNSGEYRNKWFKFQEQQRVEYVREEVEMNEEEFLD
ncbi:UPF0158 family protein [Flammeovirga sp. OC4]|uniref:UPF0158 family protein n=1 Tax=Flammeovirga sp. OC4 TaxID=1382345 RepID=UPI0005C61D51|nr:UPF0158 family protein [Flammeovirga sp. OC4]